jgi:hypothetical protein
MLTITPEGESEHPCPDCANTTKTVWGLVDNDSGAYAVYYARWTSGHPERGALLYISMRGWGEEGDPRDKVAVGLDSRMGDDRPGFQVVNASELSWSKHDQLGRPLGRDEAFASGAAQEAFAIVDELIEQDDRVRHFYLHGN